MPMLFTDLITHKLASKACKGEQMMVVLAAPAAAKGQSPAELRQLFRKGPTFHIDFYQPRGFPACVPGPEAQAGLGLGGSALVNPPC